MNLVTAPAGRKSKLAGPRFGQRDQLSYVFRRQGRVDEARVIYDRASSTSSELGLFAEEYDTRSEQMLGNFPQALTHLSHIVAAVAIARATGEMAATKY